MFSLLNPLALWLSPLLAAPLLIHFLGRTKAKLRDFPSVLLIRGQLARAMRRQKLRNRWLLLLRTLLLLCLFLSAGDPVWRPRDAWPLPTSAGLFLNNGAYAQIPHEGATVWETQLRLKKSLDSLVEGHALSENLLADVAAKNPVSRFGNRQEMNGGFSRLLTTLQNQSRPGPTHLFLPVFDWGEMSALRDPLLRAFRDQEQLRVVFLEFPDASRHLSPFTDFSLAHPGEGMLSVRLGIQPQVSGSVFEWKQSAGYGREIAPKENRLEIQHPFSGAEWLNGIFSLANPESQNLFAFPRMAVSIRIPPPATWCHVGNGLASLASLGHESPRQAIRNFYTGRIPEAQSDSCDFLFLADPEEANDALLALAAERARRGGKVVLSLGPKADLALFNRALLVPLGLGRLTDLVRGDFEVQAAQSSRGPGIRSGNWGKPGTVQIHVALNPDSGATVLLTANRQPILVQRNIGKGSLLLWTTSLDDATWSDLGLGPWPTLMHQAFAGSDWEMGAELRAFASDSLLYFPAPEGDALQIFDPEGATFKRMKRDPAGWSIGPFDRLGLYRLESMRGKTRDTTWTSIQLGEARLTPEKSDSKRLFLESLGSWKSRTALVALDGSWAGLYGGRKLRLWILALAALLLLVEGVVSLSRSGGRAPVSRD